MSVSPPVDPGLRVFVSSDQNEFKRARKLIAERLEGMPFLQPVLLEESGADIHDVRTASIREARSCDIYVGVFGERYSELTIAEYRAAVEEKEPCLTYVKRTRGRSPRLEGFIRGDLRNRFKYHKFRTIKELVDQVERDLTKLQSGLLRAGLANVAETKAETAEFEVVARPQEGEPFATDQIRQRLLGAETAISDTSYVEAVTLGSVAIELVLGEFIRRERGEPKRRLSLGGMIRTAVRSGLLSSKQVNLVRRVQLIRNRMAHLGDMPSREEAQLVVEAARQISQVLPH